VEDFMNRHARRLAVAALLAAGIWVLATAAGRGQQDDKEVKEAKDAVTKLVNAMRQGGNAGPQAAEVAKKVEIENLMIVFKPRNKGGFGIGPKPNTITPDGIEQKIINMAKLRLKQDRVAKQKEPLIEMTERVQAVAEITQHYMPPKKAGAIPADWKKFTQQMKKSAQDLGNALKGGDPMKIKAAATELNANCSECHSVFRD
jgi:hypothetical protein